MKAGMTRRELLQAGAAAGAVALSADPLIQTALAAAKPAGKLSDIDHVVILIQENRSFDHYFGTLSGVRGFADPSGLTALHQQGYPVEGFGGELLPFHLQAPGSPDCFPDITHDWVPQHESWDSGAMDAFVKTHLAVDGSQAGPATMGYYERADIPYYYGVADAFTICDSYHCSVLGPTDPNRLYSMSGTIDPDGLSGGPLVETLGATQRKEFAGTFTWTTMPEQLSAAGVTWKVYTDPAQGSLDNPLIYFKNFQTDPALQALAFKPTTSDFFADTASGSLPQVSWINIAATETEHPGFSTAKVGERAVQKVLTKLMANKKQWAKTALFLTWDENGGFFDHVAPPVAPPETAGEYLTVPDISKNAGATKGPIGLGFRVPMLIASPFSRGGFVASDTFDHTSMLRFLETRFGAEVPNLSTWRREATGDLTSAFNFVKPDNSNPKLEHVKLTHKERLNGGCLVKGPVVPPPNSLPSQEPGTRPKPSGL